MTNAELISKIKDFANEQKELLNGFELQSDFRRGETAAYSAILSFLSTLESERPTEQEKEVKPCHKTRNRLAEWSKTPEGRAAYEKVAEEMRNQIVPNDLEEAAKEHVNNIAYCGDDIELEKEQSKRDFIAGAKWQKEQDEKEQADLFTIVALDAAQRAKEQMMEEAVEGYVVKDITGSLAVTAKGINLDGFKFGDKVRIIVCKNED